MTRAAFDGPITWTHSMINGKMTSSCDVGRRRLYVCERFGAIEAWVDQVKVGNFATMSQAKAACLKRLGLPVPGGGPKLKTQPKLPPPPNPKPRPEAKFYEPRLAKGAKFGDPKNRRPAEDTNLAAYPITDFRDPGVPVVKVLPEPMRPTLSLFKQGPACKCGAVLGRSGKCPALCQPLPKPLPVYTGPKIVGQTHIGRMAQPVTGWIG